MATTKSISDKSGKQYDVSYTYLPDGEVSASFTYTYPNKDSWTNKANTSFPLAAQGTHEYVYQGNAEGLVTADGSVQVLNPGNDCNNFYGGAGCIENDPDFVSLIANIKSNAPANQFPPGLTFNTPPGTASGTYLMSGQYPVSLATDSNGNVIAVQSVNATGFGSGMYWYNLGNGYYVIDSGTSGYGYLEGGNMPSGYIAVLENAAVGNVSAPTELTDSVAVVPSSQIGSSGFSNLPQATAPITFDIQAVGGVSTLTASGIKVIAIPNSPTLALNAIVTYNNALQSIVNAGGVAAYQYIIANNLNGADVIPLANGGYQVSPASGAALAFDQNGNQSNASVPSITVQDFLSQVQNASSVAQIIGLAEEAGLAISQSNGNDSQGVLVFDAATGETLASVGEWDDPLFPIASSTPISFGTSAQTLALAFSTPMIAPSFSDTAGLFNDFISNVFAAGNGSNCYGKRHGEYGGLHRIGDKRRSPCHRVAERTNL